ncbi:uncharacterized protein LOC126875909 [Bombus huntii]|uniref:uncharacterized protein LOC126875909 n=1 Tax=Bombus huntii TaxID=85661 RepID=UPI0021AAF043|nr:uncharacterized protein LOC126875909 [Bombus huntii]
MGNAANGSTSLWLAETSPLLFLDTMQGLHYSSWKKRRDHTRRKSLVDFFSANVALLQVLLVILSLFLVLGVERCIGSFFIANIMTIGNIKRYMFTKTHLWPFREARCSGV